MLATLRSWFRGGNANTTKQWEEEVGDDGLEAVQASDDWMRANAGSKLLPKPIIVFCY